MPSHGSHRGPRRGCCSPWLQASAQALERRLKPGTSPACVVPPSLWLPPCWLWMGWSGPWKWPSVLLHRRRSVHPYGGNGRRGRPDRYGGTAAGPLAGRDRLCLSGGAGMMEREWRSLLAMYGQEVTLRLEGMEDQASGGLSSSQCWIGRGSNASLLPWPASGGPVSISRTCRHPAGGRAEPSGVEGPGL